MDMIQPITTTYYYYYDFKQVYESQFFHLKIRTDIDYFIVLYSRDRDQDHPHGKQMQKSKMAVWGGPTNSCEERQKVKEKKKDIPIWM